MKKITLVSFMLILSIIVNAQFTLENYYGHWLLQSYAQNLLKTKSAFIAQTRAAEVTEFIFAKALGDSVMVCFNNLEGGRFPIHTYPTHIEFETFEGGPTYRVEINNEDKTPTLIFTSPEDGSKEVYMFFEGEELEFDAVQRWVNSHVLSDTYTQEIESGARMRGLNDNVVFAADGVLKGVFGFDMYEVVTRFDQVVEFDVLKFINSRTGHEELKAWEIHKNKLYIYDLIENTEDYGYKKGKLILKLNKQKSGLNL